MRSGLFKKSARLAGASQCAGACPRMFQHLSVQRSCLRLALVSFKLLAAKYWLTACPCVTLAGPSRYALLGASSVTFLGLLKLNLFGPGITETVRMLWRRPDKAAPAKK